jgi:hypothetical protein
MKAFSICLVIIILISASAAKDKKPKTEEDAVVWGLLSQNAGCVIFKEFHKTNVKFWGVAISSKTVACLEVVESQNYELSQTTWIEDQEGLDQLLRIATKDKIKFVKIPEEYTDDQLEKARVACKEPSVTP